MKYWKKKKIRIKRYSYAIFFGIGNIDVREGLEHEKVSNTLIPIRYTISQDHRNLITTDFVNKYMNPENENANIYVNSTALHFFDGSTDYLHAHILTIKRTLPIRLNFPNPNFNPIGIDFNRLEGNEIIQNESDGKLSLHVIDELIGIPNTLKYVCKNHDSRKCEHCKSYIEKIIFS